MGNGPPFVSSENLLYEILVPSGRNAVMIRAEAPVELVRRSDCISNDTLILLVSNSFARAILARMLAVRLIGLKTLGIYVVMPSTNRPEFIVPWLGRASRSFFRSEATSPYNSSVKYITKWILASIGIAPLLQHCFVIVCGRD